jgi:hypothetical protein
MICSIHMRWKKGEGGGSISWSNRWCLGCFWYDASHIEIIQDFDKLYIRGTWWIRAHVKYSIELLLSYFMFLILIF